MNNNHLSTERLIPDWDGIVRAWLDIPDQSRTLNHPGSHSSCIPPWRSPNDSDSEQSFHNHNNPSRSQNLFDTHSSSLPDLVPSAPSSTSQPVVAEYRTFASDLSSDAISTTNRKRSYASESHTSVNSYIRAKRRAMQRLSPPLSYVFGPLTSPPSTVAAFITRFDMSRLEFGCIPWTPAVEALLQTHNPLAYYPPHARNCDIPVVDEQRALALVTWAISVYGLIINCTERAQDRATWSAPVRQLLSIIPASLDSVIPSPPPVSGSDRILFTIDASTKITRKTILPEYPTVKVDALLAFNPNHPALRSITRTVVRHDLAVNAFSDPAIDDCIVLLGVEIKGPTGDAAPATAEYQLAVWGAKTLEMACQLTEEGQPGSTNWCDLAVGITICGHTWSAYLIFWDDRMDEDESSERGVVLYGPIEVASSANLYGEFKLVAFMAELNTWADEVLESWKVRVMAAGERISKGSRSNEGTYNGNYVLVWQLVPPPNCIAWRPP